MLSIHVFPGFLAYYVRPDHLRPPIRIPSRFQCVGAQERVRFWCLVGPLLSAWPGQGALGILFRIRGGFAIPTPVCPWRWGSGPWGFVGHSIAYGGAGTGRDARHVSALGGRTMALSRAANLGALLWCSWTGHSGRPWVLVRTLSLGHVQFFGRASRFGVVGHRRPGQDLAVGMWGYGTVGLRYKTIPRLRAGYSAKYLSKYLGK